MRSSSAQMGWGACWISMRRFINILLISIAITFLGLGILELAKFAVIEKENDELRQEVIEVPEAQPDGADPDDPLNRRIDFESLQSINPDIKGWIYIPGTKIDYPILIGSYDQEYLSRDYRGDYLYAGSIFAYKNTDLKEDSYVQLFGHNMITKQMFGDLTKFQSQDFVDQNPKMYIYLPHRTREYSLASAFGCRYDDVIFTQEFEDLKDVSDNLMERSIIQCDVSENTQQIYTLATCQGYAGTPNRFTVSYFLETEKYVLE